MKITKRASGIHPSLTLEITAKAKKMKSEGADVVSFGAGEPDFNTPAYICNAAKTAIDEGYTKYTPASGTVDLKRAICAKLKKDNNLDYTEKNIVVSNGAKHALANVLLAVVEDGDEVILPAPYWLTYTELISFCGGKTVVVDTKPINGFKITPEELKTAITPKTKAFIFNNPNNPTGVVYSPAEVYALAKVLEDTDICVISDEIYEKLNYVGESISIASYSEKLKKNTVVINGVSKTYAMTGWRIGYTASEENVAKAISSMQSHMTSNPCSIAQCAALAAYVDEGGDAFLTEMKASFDKRRNLICSALSKIGAEYIYPEGAFYVMVKVSGLFGKTYENEIIDGAFGFATLLLQAKHVAVIPCESFGAEGYVRLSYAISEDDIIKGVSRIGEFIAEVSRYDK